MKKIFKNNPIKIFCYYFGRFDPIHDDHIRIIVATQYLGYDVIVVPAFSPPHKTVSSFSHRLAMCLKAANQFNFEVNDIESRLPTPTYTINTLRNLVKDFDNTSFKTNFIAGSDTVELMKDWFEGELLLSRLNILQSPRSDRFIDGYGKKLNAILGDISSTQIREMLCKGEDISRMVPECVKDYILRNELYTSK